jgi:hypothetical protein
MMDEERLAGYFETIYEALSARGVPEDRLPTPWAILSHVMDCVDYEALSEWIENFAALEAIEDSENEDSESESSESTSGSYGVRRPAYLKAVSAPAPHPDTDIEDEDT